MGFNIFLFLWSITNDLLPVLGIRSLFPIWVKQAPKRVVPLPLCRRDNAAEPDHSPGSCSPLCHGCDRHPGTPYSAGLMRFYFLGSWLECATSSHLCTYGLNTKTVSLRLIFPTGFFLSHLSDADLNKLYSCLIIEKHPGVWRLHYKYTDWSTFISDCYLQTDKFGFKWHHT